MTDGFRSFTYCARIPLDFLLNISTWSPPFYPANLCCRITMGEGLKIINLKLSKHIQRKKIQKATKDISMFLLESLNRPVASTKHTALSALSNKITFVVSNKCRKMKRVKFKPWLITISSNTLISTNISKNKCRCDALNFPYSSWAPKSFRQGENNFDSGSWLTN